jgi:hypothetical protein
MSMVRPLRAVVTRLVFVAGLLGCNESNAEPDRSHVVFLGSPFIIGETNVLVGTSDNPLYSDLPPLILSDRILLTDPLSNQVRAFDREGAPLAVIGSRGSGEMQFEMPYGLATDSYGRLYVNDRGNSRVLVLGPDGEFLERFLAVGQNEQILVDERSGEVQVLMVGATSCAGAPRCLLTWYSMRGERLASLAPDERSAPVSSWTAASADDGRVYLVNVLGSVVSIHVRDRGQIADFGLSSPAMVRFQADRRESAMDMLVLLDRLRREPYTLVRSLTVMDTLLVVSLERKNWPDSEDPFFADVYSLEGQLRYTNIPTPGFLTGSGSRFAFVYPRRIGHGAIEIREAQLCAGDPGDGTTHGG